MTQQEINEAIAFHLGWTKETKEIEHQDGYQWTEVVTHWRTPGGTRFSSCEDYCNDLNAMHEAESLIADGDDKHKYASLIGRHDTWNLLHATARQRAEAFVKTIGKWKTA